MANEYGKEDGELISRSPSQENLLFLRQQYEDEIFGADR